MLHEFVFKVYRGVILHDQKLIMHKTAPMGRESDRGSSIIDSALLFDLNLIKWLGSIKWNDVIV